MCKILLAFVVAFSTVLNTEALTVVPFVHSFDPQSSDEKSFQYYVENKTNDFLAFEISVFRRKLDKKGNDILERDTDSFLIRPSQIIIPPHTYRNVKAKWRGNEEFKKNTNKEQAFRVIMSQFPINLNKKKEKNQAAIQVVYEIKASLYATPKNAKPDLKVVSENADVIVLKNDGNRRAELRKSDLVIRNKKITDLVRSDDVDTVIMAKSIREYRKKAK
ncbi:MAG: hypothetical protein J5821_00455 [Alphaproteobacteria bacterium]|nr:hypothetical protein [Alphaproteobacteria bacterium]